MTEGQTERQNRGRRRGRRWAVLAVMLAAGGAVAVAAVPQVRQAAEAALHQAGAQAAPVLQRMTQDAPPSDPAPPRGVRVVQVQAQPALETRDFAGVIVPRWQTHMGFRVGGRIEERRVEVGQRVRRGDILFTLDPADYLAGLAAAEADLAAAEAQVVQTSAELARQDRLTDRGFTSRSVLDRLQAADRAAAEQVKAARQARTLAQNRLGYTTLTAPEDGTVTAVLAEAGQVVDPGMPVLTLVRDGGREAQVNLPEGLVAGLGDWQAALALWADGGAPLPVALREVAAEADPASRTFAARFTLPPDLADRAALGMSVTLTLSRLTGPQAATLPASAVFLRDGKPQVWVMADSGDRALRQPVTILATGARTMRVSGLDDGARVITLGVHRIDEGLPLRVVEDTRIAEATP
jgi:RND family efflux transporter MFP subunit